MDARYEVPFNPPGNFAQFFGLGFGAFNELRSILIQPASRFQLCTTNFPFGALCFLPLPRLLGCFGNLLFVDERDRPDRFVRAQIITGKLVASAKQRLIRSDQLSEAAAGFVIGAVRLRRYRGPI